MKIIGKTNGFIAARDIMFNGKTEITIASGLSLAEARQKLLDMFNELYEEEDGYEYAETWEEANEHDPKLAVSLSPNDGKVSFEYDSRHYEIVEEDE